MGALLVRLCEPEIERLATEGDGDERCTSCAFRPGTVPNGCPQTMSDAIKAVAENVPFWCHATKERYTKLCHGWLASRIAIESRGGFQQIAEATSKYEFSPPDEEVAR